MAHCAVTLCCCSPSRASAHCILCRLLTMLFLHTRKAKPLLSQAGLLAGRSCQLSHPGHCKRASWRAGTHCLLPWGAWDPWRPALLRQSLQRPLSGMLLLPRAQPGRTLSLRL